MSNPTLRDPVREKIKKLRTKIVEPCGTCNGTGYLGADDNRVNRCDCMIVFRYLKELVKAYLPVIPYWTLSLSKLRIEDYVMKFAKMYIKNMDRAMENGLGAVLLGPNGIGKTSVMIEIGKYAIVRGYTVKYFTLTTYIDAVFSKNLELIRDLENADLILIDELDKTMADRSSNKLDRVVDDLLRRMSNNGKAMLLSTNWDEDELTKVFGQSTMSLLKRNNKLLPMEGSDYSELLDQSWIDRLVNDFDYYESNIVKMAEMYERMSWQK